MTTRTKEQVLLIEQLKQVAEGLGETFSPFCEVVVHDLLDPKQAILAIHNNLSGRSLGEPATDLGLARIADPDYQQIIANYANKFADGRRAKSTSVGIKDSSGNYIAALCLNVDLTLFQGIQNVIQQFSETRPDDNVNESLDPAGTDAIRARIDKFAAKLATTPRALRTQDRRLLMAELKEAGFMDVRKSVDTVAQHLGVSRAAIYTYTK